jgi:hypothetical protein
MQKLPFDELLERLEEYWKSVDFPLLPKLASGIDIESIEPKNFEGQLPEEMKILYKWRNGVKREFATDLIGRLTLFSGAIPMAIQKVWWVHETMAVNEFGWGRSKIPLFESGGGDYFLLNCDVEASEYGQIYFFSPGAIDFELIITVYDSLTTLFQTVLESFKEDLYQVDDNQITRVADYPALHRLEKRLNPRSDYWRLFDK